MWDLNETCDLNRNGSVSGSEKVLPTIERQTNRERKIQGCECPQQRFAETMVVAFSRDSWCPYRIKPVSFMAGGGAPIEYLS